MTVRADEQLFQPSAKVILYEVDATVIGGALYRFIAQVNEQLANVVWQGNTYTAFPCVAQGFEWSGKGQLPRPSLLFGNIGGLISVLCLDHDDMVGAKVTRKMTLAKYLDAVNFAGGNPNADPNAHWPDEVFQVNRKVRENQDGVEFELSSSLDVEGVRLPRRFVIQNVCTWKYRSAECGYAGGPVAKEDDTPTSDSNLDVCGLRVASCKLRFGATAELPYGGFPSVGLVR